MPLLWASKEKPRRRGAGLAFARALSLGNDEAHHADAGREDRHGDEAGDQARADDHDGPLRELPAASGFRLVALPALCYYAPVHCIIHIKLLKYLAIFGACVLLTSACPRTETSSKPASSDWKNPGWLAQYSELERTGLATNCPEGMVAIPAGQVRSIWTSRWNFAAPRMGDVRLVKSFCMDRFEYPDVRYELPVVNKSWFEAQKLCAREGKRLCREDEWEFACTASEGFSYSYGPLHIPYLCNSDNPKPEFAAIAPAGSRFQCRNRWGVFDLDGNVSEWVNASEEEYGSTVGVIRGGTAWNADYGGSCWSRHTHPLTDHNFGDDGFRCCLDGTN